MDDDSEFVGPDGKCVYKILSLRNPRIPGSATDTYYIKGPDRRRVLNVFVTQYGRTGFIVDVMPPDHPFEFEC